MKSFYKKILSIVTTLVLLLNLVIPSVASAQKRNDGQVTISIEQRVLGRADIVKSVQIPIQNNEKASLVLDRVLKSNNIEYQNTGSLENAFYLATIKTNGEWLGEFDHGFLSGWMYSINGVMPNVGMADYYLKDGDVFRLHYTAKNYGEDINAVDRVHEVRSLIEEIEGLNKNKYTKDSWDRLQNVVNNIKSKTPTDLEIGKMMSDKLGDGKCDTSSLIKDMSNYKLSLQQAKDQLVEESEQQPKPEEPKPEQPKNQKPVISASNRELKVGDLFDPMQGVSASDNEDGYITDKVRIVENEVIVDVNNKVTIPGKYKITYEVCDSEGLVTTKSIKINVEESTENSGVIVNKLVGNTRYETSTKISNRGWNQADNIVIVNSSAMSDALSATPFAKAKDAPILLTEKDSLNDETKKEIIRLKAKNISIIGGTSVVSENIVSQLKSMGVNVDRISGDDRYTTSLEIAKRLGGISEVAVVNGVKGLPDAVSIAPVAGERNIPIILSSPTSGTKIFDTFIKNNNITTSYIIGGESAVSAETANKLPNSKRLGGPNRNETNAMIIKTFYTSKDLNNAFVAKDGMKNQNELIDALAVGVLGAKEKSPIIIVGNQLNTKQEEVLSSKDLKEITQVGGNGNENAFNQLVSMFKK